MNEAWGQAMMNALTDMMKETVYFLPKLLAMVSFVLLGVVVGWAIKASLQRLLKAVRIDALSERWGLQPAFARAGVKQPLSQILGRLAFWVVFVLFVFTGVDALHLPATADLMSQIVSFLPSIFAAAFLLLVGILLGNFFAEAALIALVNAQIEEARLIANLARWGIFLFIGAMVLTQLGIAKEIVVAAFAIFFGGVVLALAIAIGLGGRNIAKDALERRWRKDEDEKDEMTHL